MLQINTHYKDSLTQTRSAALSLSVSVPTNYAIKIKKDGSYLKDQTVEQKQFVNLDWKSFYPVTCQLFLVFPYLY